jgi:Tfp pilus assembly ATPase PilU
LNLLTGIIEASVSEGMHSFDQHLMQYLRQGLESEETARYYAVNWNRLDMEMHGYVSSASGILKPDSMQ